MREANMKRFRLKPGEHVKIEDWDPRDTSAFDGGKQEAKERIITLNGKLESLQEVLYAENKHKILVVLQGMDTSGKDGVIRRVFEGANPQGVRVANFKAPTAEELARDFLWRIHRQVPARGEIVIFNRSHYEDVLIVRVHNLVPEEVWKRRYEQINQFERMLADNGTVLLKFFLHISQDEQKERLQARLDDPTKIWKFNPSDLKERALWPEYMKAYEAMLNKTGTEWAPWHIVPADKKWFRDLIIAEALVDALEKLDSKYPKPAFDPATIKIE
jgi:PPK2 family polyphosphate:nucleotide phosphotransferase